MLKTILLFSIILSFNLILSARIKQIVNLIAPRGAGRLPFSQTCENALISGFTFSASCMDSSGRMINANILFQNCLSNLNGTLYSTSYLEESGMNETEIGMENLSIQNCTTDQMSLICMCETPSITPSLIPLEGLNYTSLENMTLPMENVTLAEEPLSTSMTSVGELTFTQCSIPLDNLFSTINGQLFCF